jgi:hypothetical protein
MKAVAPSSTIRPARAASIGATLRGRAVAGQPAWVAVQDAERADRAVLAALRAANVGWLEDPEMLTTAAGPTSTPAATQQRRALVAGEVQWTAGAWCATAQAHAATLAGGVGLTQPTMSASWRRAVIDDVADLVCVHGATLSTDDVAVHMFVLLGEQLRHRLARSARAQPTLVRALDGLRHRALSVGEWQAIWQTHWPDARHAPDLAGVDHHIRCVHAQHILRLPGT